MSYIKPFSLLTQGVVRYISYKMVHSSNF